MENSGQQEAPCGVVAQISCIALYNSAVEWLISAILFHRTFLTTLTHTYTSVVTKGTIHKWHCRDTPFIWSLPINCEESQPEISNQIWGGKKADLPTLWTQPSVLSEGKWRKIWKKLLPPITVLCHLLPCQGKARVSVNFPLIFPRTRTAECAPLLVWP